MNQRKLLLFTLVLLLIPAGIVAAQSSANYTVQRFVMMGGGASDSANFSVTSAIGQAATDVVYSSSYKVSAGFLFPISNRPDFKTWLPLVLR